MIENRKTSVTYRGDGNTTVFPFAFAISSADNIHVAVYDTATEVATEITRDYFVDVAAKVVHYPGYAPGQTPAEHAQPPKLPAGKNITIYRKTSVDQLTDLGEKYPLPYIEAMADKATAIMQEHEEAIGRAVMVQHGSGIDPAELVHRIFETGAAASDNLRAAQQSASAAAGSEANAKRSETAAREMAERMNAVLASAVDELKQKLSAEYVPQTQASREHQELRTAISNAGIAILQRSKTYAVGDIAYSKHLPSWARLECVKAGMTGASIPNLAEVHKCGIMVTDGNAVWIVDDVRDGARVGDIILRPTLRDGYIKANGATVKASEYPRLLTWVQESNMTVTAEQYQTDCSKYVYDAAQDRLTLPNAVGRVLMGGEATKSVEAGLPNIEIRYRDRVYTYEWEWQQGQENKILEDKRKQVTLTNPDGQYSYGPGNGSVYGGIVTLDASKSNPIYGRSDTVQPPAISLIAQIKY